MSIRTPVNTMLNGIWLRWGRMALLLIAFLSSLSQAAVVLQYHHVSDETPASTSISPQLFEQHLRYLKDNGFLVWPLDKITNALASAKPLPDKVVAITFDDAYDSIIETAFPLLKRYQFPFTVFVSTQPIDQQVASFMTWSQLRALHHEGVILANHGHTHMHFVRRLKDESKARWLERITQDIELAEQRLKAELGGGHKLLAYPYGEFTDDVMGLVEGLGYIAFGQQSGAVGLGMPLTALPRFPMTNTFGAMRQFKTKVASLPLAIESISPSARIVTTDQFQSGLSIHFVEVVDQLACYLSGYGRVEIQQNEHQVFIPNMPDLPTGRSRLNCTKPSTDKGMSGRYHWFSYFWMKPELNGDWYSE